ncbi:nitroreductase [Actinoplanes sp. NPDC023936]|uniref:Acg family FMN-binding oxidoreductase n=1 Tax=Actinoplanes sp. NPDC023936 TaxID=3154910 RepID=UPI00340936E0
MFSDAMTHPTDTQVAAHALVEAATMGGYAPSICNTQPWRWRLTAGTLELRLAPERILRVTDPEARLATLSCGAALHHAHVALRAQGWHATVTREPHDAPDVLARLRITEREAADPASLESLRVIPLRHTDRRPIIGTPVDPADLAAVVAAIRAHDTDLHTLRPDQIIELAAAVDHAQRSEAADPAWQAELAAWAGGTRPSGSGVPDATIPDRATPTTVPSRDFGHHGALPVSGGHDTAAVFVMLYGRGDDPVDWLRAGEALSAGWLTATGHGVCVVPYSAPIEVIASRQAMRAMIASVGHPYLLLRLGRPDPAATLAPHAPRLPVDQIIEYA